MRRAWAILAVPGMAWLAAFFLVAFYAVVAVGLGNITDVYDPVPHWNPLDWNIGYLLQALEDVLPGGRTWPVFVRTLAYVVVAVVLSLAIGYPVAYYVSRYATGRSKAALLILLVAPFWISYLMRMFAWTNLLAEGGYAADVLNTLSLDSLFSAVGLLDGEDWLGGQHIAVIMGLVYGYVPYLILPLYASLDRIDQRLIEAARDLGASSAGAFRRVVLPLSRAGTLGGIVLIALPMFGDYYTPDLMSGSPRTAMLGNTINNYVQGGPDKALGAAMTLLLSAFLLVFMLYYLRELRRESAA
ncbi:ABC transporter permease [Solirubrobacter phytolaccae]|uniref:ABC transporter permease n=1 Tax=Solirubrobacter phytolaccae TaxID=1404360 RepID=A0A9X3ND17_9ACTN|nr:ABC transporter permease [Solirubrobacter phytolaccae]MDA0180132.1 ABC transporter permease [Solirubrobacter phytolaccae]